VATVCTCQTDRQTDRDGQTDGETDRQIAMFNACPQKQTVAETIQKFMT